MIKQRIISSILVLLMIFAYPASVWAATDDPSITPSETSATDSSSGSSPAPELVADTPAEADSSQPSSLQSDPVQVNQGPTSPTGADGDSYRYNSATGLWENDYYTWDPVTFQTKPKTPQTYSYNPQTGMWDTTEWVWDAPSGKYIPNKKSIKNNPNAISLTGPNSSNSLGSSSSFTGVYDLFYDVRISNDIYHLASSGNVLLAGNTLGGDATSGNAIDITNIINLLQASWNLQNAGSLMTFVANIDGNVVGDLYIDPASINNTGPGSLNVANSQNDANLTVNSNGSGLIDNNVTLNVQSGDASVNGNTAAGSATSGNADAIANIVNVINSVIAAGQSFVGVININGNFDGDILLPPDFLEQLIASGAPNATINISKNQNTNIDVNTTSNQTILNQVQLNAGTGDTDVSGNTLAGDSASGNASTNLTLFNLTGRQVIGSNSLLVFVNVLGTWVGLIMDSPAGTSTAGFCGGSCQISENSNTNASFNDVSNNTINNNLKINASSGDASVTGNTSAGNARSGNATASANLLNINNSQLSMSNWFGLLFINVLGTWHGSFGLNTAAGNPLAAASGAGAGSGSNSAGAAANQVFMFAAASQGNPDVQALINQVGTSQSNNDKKTALVAGSGQKQPPAHQPKASTNGWMVPAITSAIVFALFGLVGLFEFSDRIKVSFINRKLNRSRGQHLGLPSLNIGRMASGQAAQIRDWLTSFSWKFPIL